MLVKEIKKHINRLVKNPLALFLLKGFLFYILWGLIIYDYVITSGIHNWLINRLVEISLIALRCFYQDVTGMGSEIFISGRHVVHIGIPCDGLDVMGVFACIVLAFNARWFHKGWIIVTGCITVFILNIARICGLAALIAENHIKAFDINHKYVFNTILYGVLLIIFSIWSTKFGTKPKSI